MQENVFFFLKTKNSVKYLYDNISVEDGLALMRKHKYTAMPIINKEGVYVGTLTEQCHLVKNISFVKKAINYDSLFCVMCRII